MNLEAIQISFIVAAVLVLFSLMFGPATAAAMSRLPAETITKNADTTDGPACDLPPFVEVEGSDGAASADVLPPLDKEAAQDYKTATFAMGWFWGPDSRYGSLDGVLRTRVGYAGGTRPNPTYRRIGDHMETIQIDYDPEKVSYTRLLELFFSSHTPTRPSFARQYASAIFYHDEEQKFFAQEAMKEASEKFRKNIATELIPYDGFTRAEDYHQKYYLRNTRDLMKQYKGLFPTEDAFTDSTAVARINGYIGGNGTSEQLEKEKGELGINSGGIDALRTILRKAGK